MSLTFEWRTNDDHPTMQDVVDILVACTPLGEIEANLVMLQAHTTGIALVMTEPLEPIEYYHEQLGFLGLITTIEPACSC